MRRVYRDRHGTSSRFVVEVHAGDIKSRFSSECIVQVVRGNSWRRNMIKQPVIFVKRQEEYRLAPDLRIGR